MGVGVVVLGSLRSKSGTHIVHEIQASAILKRSRKFIGFCPMGVWIMGKAAVAMLMVWLISVLIFLDLLGGELCYRVVNSYRASSARIFPIHHQRGPLL